MSQTIENRIVEMQFENKQFESGVQESLSTLDKLKKSLNFDDASKNLQDFSNSVTKNLDMNGIGSAVEKLKDRFSASGVAGMEVIRRLTDFAIDAGKKIASALDAPFAQIRSGGWSRAMNIEDAKFQLKGLGIAWETVSDDINYAVADTAYGLDVAAKACSQLSASGVQAGEDMKAALRGISGVAAMGNTEYENISQIFTKAAGNGKVMADELNRISQYGLNARSSLAKFYNAILDGDESVKDIPEQVKNRVKTVTEGMKVTEAQVSEMASKGKIDFETFAYAMDNAFGEHAKKANETFMGSLRNIKAALSKIGAEFATPIIKGAIPVFNEIRVFLNDLRKQMGPLFDVFSKIANLVSETLTKKIKSFALAFNDLGGAVNIGHALENVFTSFLKIIGAVVDAFNAVFPPAKSFENSILSVTEGIEKFSEKLVISDNAVNGLRNVLTILFTVMKNGFSYLTNNILPVVGKVASTIINIIGFIVKLIAYLASLILKLDVVQKIMSEIIASGGVLHYAIEKLKAGFMALVSILTDTSTLTGKVFTTIVGVVENLTYLVAGGLYLAFVKIKDVFGYFDTHDPLGSLVEGAKRLVEVLQQLPILGTIISGIELAFTGVKTVVLNLVQLIKDFIANVQSGMSVVHAIGAAMTSVVGGIIGLIGSLYDKVKSFFSIFTEDKVIQEDVIMPIENAGNAMVGVEHQLSKTKGEVVQTSNAFQKGKNAIVNFATAVINKMKDIRVGQVLLFAFGTTITLLAAELVKLTRAFTGLTQGLTSVTYGLGEFFKNFGKKKSTFAENMIATAIAIGAVTASLWAMSKIPIDKLLVVAGVLEVLLITMGIFSKIGGAGHFSSAIAAFSAGILMLTAALYALDQVNMEKIWTKVGILATICGIILTVSIILSKAAPKLSAGGIGVLAIAGSVYILAKALDVISHADLENIKNNWVELSAVILALAAFASIASNVGIAAALGLIGFVGVLKLLNANVDLIKKNFGSIQNAFKTIVDVLKGVIEYLYNGLKKAAEDMQQNETFAKVVQGSIVAVIGSLAAIILAVGHAGKGIKKAAVGFVLLAAAISGLMFVTVKIAEFAQGIDPGMIDKATDLLKKILIFIGVVTGLAILSGLKAFNSDAIDKTLKDVRKIITSMALLILSIGGFAAMVGSLSAAEFERAKTALISTEIIIGIIVAFCTIVSAASSKTEGTSTSFSTFAGILLLIGGLVGSIAVLMFAIGEVDWEKDKATLLTVGAAFTVMVGSLIGILLALGQLEKYAAQKGSMKAVVVLGAFVGIIGAIGLVVYELLKKIPDTPTLVRAGAIAGGLIVFIGILVQLVKSLEKSTNKILTTTRRESAFNLSIKALGRMVAAIAVFAIGLYALQDVDAGRVWGQATAIIFMLAGITALTLALEKFAKDTKFSITKTSWANIQKTFLIIAEFLAAFGVLAYAFYRMQEVDAGRLWGQMTALTVCMTVLSTLALAVEHFAKKLKLNWSTIGKTTVAIAAMVALFGALILLFNYIDDNFESDTLSLLAKSQTIMLVLAELEGLLYLLGRFFDSKILTNAAIAEIELAAMVGLFAWLTKIFKTIDGFKSNGGALIAKSQTIMLVMGELIGLIELMGWLVNSEAIFILGAIGEVALWPMIKLFDLLTNVFAKIDALKTEGIMAKSQTIALVMTELIALIELMGGLVYAGGIYAIGAIGELALWPMINLFDLLADVFVKIDGLKTDGIMAKSQTIILVMTELIGLIGVMGGLVYAAGEFALGGLAELALWPMINLFDLLADVFVKIDGLKVEGMLAKSQQITLVMTELVGLIAVMGLLVPLMALGGLAELALAPMIGLFGQLTQVFTIIDTLHTEGLLAKSQAIILVLLELEGLSVLSILGVIALAGAPGLDAMIDIFNKLTIVFTIIDQLHLDDLQAKAQIIVDTLFKLEGLSAIGGFIGTVLGPGLLIFAQGVQALGVACAAIGSGLTSFASGLESVANGVIKLTNTGPSITAFFTSIAVGVTTLTVSIMNSLTGLSKSVVDSINTLVNGIKQALSNGGPIVFAAAAALGLKIFDGLDSKADGHKWGADFTEQLSSGMGSKIGAVASAAANIASEIAAYLAHCGPTKGDMVGDNMWGIDFDKLLADGIDSGKNLVGNAANGIGSLITDSISSVDGFGIGELFSNMLANGLNTGIPQVDAWCNKILGYLGLVKKEAATVYSFIDGKRTGIAGSGSRDDFLYTLQQRESQLKKNIQTTQNAIRIETEYGGATSKSTNSLKAQQKQLADVQSQIKDMTTGTKAASEATNELADGLTDLGDSAKGAGGGVKEAKDAIADFYDSIESSISLFDKFEEEEAMSSEELLSNMESQILGVTNWSNQIAELATKGIDQGLLQKLADMGPSGQKYTAAFVNMTNDELVRANTLYQQSLLLPQHVTAQVFSSFELAGVNATQGFVNGLDHDTVRSQGIQFAHDFLDNFNAALGIHSPSDETFSSARYSVLGFTDGIESMMYLLETTIKQAARKVLMWFNTELGISFGISTKTVEIGKSIVEGIKTGIEDAGTQSSLFDSIRSLCNKIVEEAKSTSGLDINSPSKKFQLIGKSVDEGLAKGISDNVRMVTGEMDKTTADMVNEMRDTINKANEALIDDVDDPVIRPVLDLSNVEEGSRSINDIFSRNQVMSASRSFSNLQNQQWGSQSALLNATMDNSDVVSAVNSLKTDIDGLKEAMTNIRMVLDTGTMVGAMTPMIDQQLGMRQVYAGRGM